MPVVLAPGGPKESAAKLRPAELVLACKRVESARLAQVAALVMVVAGCGSSDLAYAPSSDADDSTGDATTASSHSLAPGDAFIDTVDIAVHDRVSTILLVRWYQRQPAVSTFVRVVTEEGETNTTPIRPGGLGQHEVPVLGIPAEIDVEVQIVSMVDDIEYASTLYGARTGVLPPKMPRPRLEIYDPEQTSAHRYLLGSVEATRSPDGYYDGPFWLYVVDRQARIVWYYTDPSSNDTMAFPRLAADTSHLLVERRVFGAGNYMPTVRRMTLDFGLFDEIPIPGLSDCIDVTPDGTILFNTVRFEDNSDLKERRPDGTIRTIWDCSAWGSSLQLGTCYSNTVDYSPATDTITMSFPYANVAVEIDRETGELVSQWGKVEGSWTFDPPEWEFQFNHFAHLTDAGTLLVSTHMPHVPHEDGPGPHAFVEFDVDRPNRRLVKRWHYEESERWPKYKGMATRLANGNVLANFGTGGRIIELTPAAQKVWQVDWPATFSHDHLANMVGHNMFVDDLYKLTTPPAP